MRIFSNRASNEIKQYSFSAVQNIWSFIYWLVYFTTFGYITNLQCDQLTVSSITQLVQHCTGIAEVMGSNPVQALIVSGFNLTTIVYNCDDRSFLHIFLRSSNIWASYIHLNTRSVVIFKLQMISLEEGAGCEWVDGVIRISENSVTYLHVLLVETLTVDRLWLFCFNFVLQILSFTNFSIVLVNRLWRKQCSIWT